MSTKVLQSLIMLRVCEIISSNRKDAYCSMQEPDDTLDSYIDFLEAFPDWGNDEELMELIDRVFNGSTEEL